ncbi:hypothetical protein CYMTET_44507 [Cymbomonas tetramitiformis]|uniref:F-box domain-containing protein n=1 Tax=Cymbomonas tetramitiformis TaxID=36881 RepID=A0AAE0EZH6_9CHLO|nr:hypothetical protein CYMTET_44507 [Cymbomonas tetramitiformis]
MASLMDLPTLGVYVYPRLRYNDLLALRQTCRAARNCADLKREIVTSRMRRLLPFTVSDLDEVAVVLEQDTHFRAPPCRRKTDYDVVTDQRWCISDNVSSDFVRVYMQDVPSYMDALRNELGPRFDELRTLRRAERISLSPRFCASFVRRLVCVKAEISCAISFDAYVQRILIPCLPILTNLRVLDISFGRWQKFCLMPETTCALKAAIANCRGIDQISLHGIPAGFCNDVQWASVTSLRLSLVDDTHMLRLKSLPQLIELHVRAIRSECTLEMLDHLTELRTLLLESDLQPRSIGSAKRRLPSTLINLRQLTLIGYTGVDLELFESYPRLIDLRLDNCRGTDRALKSVKLNGRLPNLQHFHLENWTHKLTRFDTVYLPCARTLRVLTLDTSMYFTDACAEMLRNATSLDTLRMMYLRRLNNLEFVADMRSLRSVTLKHLRSLQDYDALLRVRTLQYLHVAIDDGFARCQTLYAHPTLRTLVLLGTNECVVYEILRRIAHPCVLNHITLTRRQMHYVFPRLPTMVMPHVSRMRLDVREDVCYTNYECEREDQMLEEQQEWNE